MDILWSADAPMTPREVHDVMTRRRKSSLAYTTVMTILVRLWEKGMLDRHAEGRAYAYVPVSDRDTWTADRMQELLRTSGDPAGALAQFVRTMDANETAHLRRALGRRRRGR
jgi:predicted transcriptional regulator